MSITAEVDAERRLVRLRYNGAPPTFDEWTQAMREIFRDPAYEPGFDFVVDRRAVGPPSGEFVRSTIAFRQRHSNDLSYGRWAVVVRDPTSYGMARMAEMMMDAFGVEQAVFKDVDKAEAWLLGAEARKTG
jgi:hypothetical protein